MFLHTVQNAVFGTSFLADINNKSPKSFKKASSS